MNIGSFPPDKFLPATVKPVIARYEALRSDAEDAKTDLLDLRNGLDAARQADINDAADNLSAGIKTKPATKHYDTAIRAVHDAEAQHQAYQAAVPKVALEVKNAFRDAADEIYTIADDEFTEATGEFMQCIEALASARARWLISVAARRFVADATTGRRDIAYEAPRIDDKLADLRKEAGTDAKHLFAPRRFDSGSIHHAHIVQLWFTSFNIPSFASGNNLTVADHPDFDKAVAKMEATSGWYVDGDSIMRDIPPECVNLHRVRELPAGMAAGWALTAKNRTINHDRPRARTARSN